MIDGGKELSEITSSQRRPTPLSLNEYEANASTRNEAIVKAYESGGYTQKEIGDFFGLHYARVSRIYCHSRALSPGCQAIVVADKSTK